MEKNSPTKLQKKHYRSPKLTVYGDVRVITQENQCGDVTDAAFPAGTLFSEITCS